MLIRKIIIGLLLTIIFTGIGFLFWHNEFVYSLPTPVPQNYKAVQPGRLIAIPESLYSKKDKPVFLHFFNPDCPCSRFNINHFKSLVKIYSSEVNFAIVVMNNKSYTALQIQKKFDLILPVFFDTSIALACGVYSTPQAVIIDKDQRLFYRGNYNRSRYCTDANSNYAQQAIDSLLHHHNISPGKYAVKAYGCRLPNCLK